VFAAEAGTWTITVSGYNVPQGPQPFALVVDANVPGGTALPEVRVTVDDGEATEAGLTGGVLRVTRTGDTGSALEVAYSVSGSAVAGSDYVALSGFVTIPEGSVDATIAVNALDDQWYEAAETVVVTSWKRRPTSRIAVGGHCHHHQRGSDARSHDCRADDPDARLGWRIDPRQLDDPEPGRRHGAGVADRLLSVRQLDVERDGPVPW
jgi:hypothetical protein